MKCKDCNVWGCQYRTSNAERECVVQNTAGDISSSEGARKGFLVPEGSAMTVDWSSFRREAAKDILVGLCANNNLGFYGNSNADLATSAITIADELIKQLKESHAREND